jgi:SAM-dependent methyltransferase
LLHDHRVAIDADAFREFERRAHDRVARTYGGFFEPVTAGAIPALLDAAGVARGSRVLDVASGPGAVAAAAAARGATVVGVDLSSEMVAVARGRHPGLSFQEGDAERLPFDDGAFDAIVCNFGLGHFPRPERAAAEFLRLLAAGGRAALSWWDAPSRARVNGLFFDAVAQAGVGPPAGVPAGPPPFRFADDAELRALLTIAGFGEPAVRTLGWTHRIPSVEAWWEGGLGSLARASATVVHQPPAVQARIRAEFERLAAGYRVEGGFSVPVSAKIVTGRR